LSIFFRNKPKQKSLKWELVNASSTQTIVRKITTLFKLVPDSLVDWLSVFRLYICRSQTVSSEAIWQLCAATYQVSVGVRKSITYNFYRPKPSPQLKLASIVKHT